MLGRDRKEERGGHDLFMVTRESCFFSEKKNIIEEGMNNELVVVGCYADRQV